MEGFSSKHTALKVDVIGVETIYTVCRCVRSSFNPEIFSGWVSEGVKSTLRTQRVGTVGEAAGWGWRVKSIILVTAEAR